MHADRVKPNFDQCYLLRLLSFLMDYYNNYEGQATDTNLRAPNLHFSNVVVKYSFGGKMKHTLLKSGKYLNN